MIHGSLFSGVGGLDLGFERAGFQTVWQVERDRFCRSVLRTHFPKAKLFADVRKVGAHNLRRVDCITAGVPCQDWSVAGKRAGIGGSRSGLFFEFARILGELRPAYFVFENVPGLLSAAAGRDFGIVLSTLASFGYGLAWRVLDSRFFGVAQRRRRVFIVGSLGTMCAAEILFEPASGTGNPAASGEAGADVANSITRGSGRVGSRGCDDGANIVAAPLSSGSGITSSNPGRRREDDINLVVTPNSGGNDGGSRTEPGEHIVTQDVRGGTRDQTDHGQGIGIREGGPSYTLGAVERHAVAFNIIGLGQQGRNHAYEAERTGALQHKGNSASGNEAGTLVGAPPDPDRVRNASGIPEGMDDSAFPLVPKGLDSLRYGALGNAVTVIVAEWLARRMLENMTGR